MVRVVLSILVLVGAGLALAAPVSAAQTSCPLNFTATGMTDGSAVFHWSGFGGADGYQVLGHQGQGNTAAYSPMLGGDARDYTRQNLATGDYEFWVEAYHSGSVVASSCHRTTFVGPTGPALVQPCPANVNATFQAPNSVFLLWSRVPNATGYEVARSVDGGPLQYSYGLVGQSNHPSFTDTNAPPGHDYTYRVRSLATRYPADACNPVTVSVASVPFFPTPFASGLGLAGVAIAGLVILRRRK